MNCNDPSATAIRQAEKSFLIGLCNNNFAPGQSLVNIVPNFVNMLPISNAIQTVEFPDLDPESFSYDPSSNMVILGSQNGGGLIGFPYNNLDGVTIDYPQSVAYTYVPQST
jgi:hypothetical protein